MAQSLTFQEKCIDLDFDYEFEKGEVASREYPGCADRVDITRVRMNGVEIPMAAVNADLYQLLLERVEEEQSNDCPRCRRRNYDREQLRPVVRPLFATPQIAPTRQAGAGQIEPVSLVSLATQCPGHESDVDTRSQCSVGGTAVAEPTTQIDTRLAWQLAERMAKQGILPLDLGFRKATYALQLLADMRSKPIPFAYLDKEGCHRRAIGWFGLAPHRNGEPTNKSVDPIRLAKSYFDVEVGDWRSFRIDRLMLD